MRPFDAIHLFFLRKKTRKFSDLLKSHDSDVPQKLRAILESCGSNEKRSQFLTTRLPPQNDNHDGETPLELLIRTGNCARIAAVRRAMDESWGDLIKYHMTYTFPLKEHYIGQMNDIIDAILGDLRDSHGQEFIKALIREAVWTGCREAIPVLRGRLGQANWLATLNDEAYLRLVISKNEHTRPPSYIINALLDGLSDADKQTAITVAPMGLSFLSQPNNDTALMLALNSNDSATIDALVNHLTSDALLDFLISNPLAIIRVIDGKNLSVLDALIGTLSGEQKARLMNSNDERFLKKLSWMSPSTNLYDILWRNMSDRDVLTFAQKIVSYSPGCLGSIPIPSNLLAPLVTAFAASAAGQKADPKEMRCTYDGLESPELPPELSPELSPTTP